MILPFGKTTILGLGSNIGNRLAFLREAIVELQNIMSDIQVSSIYESEAVLPKNAPHSWNMPYLNIAVKGDTALEPEELLREVKKIESEVGRKHDSPVWSPREIDIDILTYGNHMQQDSHLTIPHGELLKRPFALLPLAEIAPKWQYPVSGDNFNKSAKQLVAALPEDTGIRKTDLKIEHAIKKL